MNQVVKYIEAIEDLSKSENLHFGKIKDFTKEVLKKSCETLGCERSNAWLLNDIGDVLECEMGYSKKLNKFDSSGSLEKKDFPKYFKNLLKNEIIVSNDAKSEPINYELVESYLNYYQITAMIDVPLRSEGKMIGVICFEHVKNSHDWSYEEMKFTQSVSQLLSLALETKKKTEYRNKLEKIIEEKEILISEINHRVKNNMAVIVSLLNLQKKKTLDKYHAELFEGIKDKVFSMALIQEQLHTIENVNEIDFCSYMRELVMHLYNSYGKEKEVSITLNTDKVNLSVSKAIPCGLIANEILTNSFKYAFTLENSTPQLTVSLRIVGEKVELIFEDNGPGFVSTSIKDGMGLDLIKGLAEQIEGNLVISSSKGTNVTLTFDRG